VRGLRAKQSPDSRVLQLVRPDSGARANPWPAAQDRDGAACEVTGSTALGERLEPEAVGRVMRRYRGASLWVIELPGRPVEKFNGDAAGNPAVSKPTVTVSAGRLTTAVRRGEAGGRKVQPRHWEAVMYSTINHQIAQARIADLHRQAQQVALARTARQGRRPHKHVPGRHLLRLPIITRRRAITA